MQDASQGYIRHVVLDGAAIDFMDATGLEVMQALLLKPPQGLFVVLADPSQDLLDIMKRGGVLQQLGETFCADDASLPSLLPSFCCALGQESIHYLNRQCISPCKQADHALHVHLRM